MLTFLVYYVAYIYTALISGYITSWGSSTCELSLCQLYALKKGAVIDGF